MNKDKFSGIGAYLIIVFLILGAFFMFWHSKNENAQYSYQELLQDVENGNISNVVIRQNSETPTGQLEIKLKNNSTTSEKILNVSDVNAIQEIFNIN